MDALVYVDPVNSNLVCCICRTPFADPTTATPCGHTFCRACITHAIDVAPCCPIDRGQLDLSDLLPAPQLVRNMVDELIVYCPNHPLGCTHTAQRQLISTHAVGCTFVPVPCPASGCTHTVLKHQADDHDDSACSHALVQCPTCDQPAPEEHVCPARETTCPHCAAPTPHNQLPAHMQSCPAIPTPCPHSTYGCTYTGPASEQHHHLQSCPFEPLKPFLALSQSRITALERTVSELKSQLDLTKKSLGPWFRPSHAPNEPDPPRFEFRPLVGRRRVSSPLHTSMFHFDESAETGVTRRRAGSGSNLRVSDDDPFSLILPPSPTEPRTETVPYIPPLNTSSSLEHTLSTLRNGLVSLAASLDMAERRQEVMVTTESLRMHEEVGSMRAIVHGLRMQVSALVMERNVAMIGRMNPRTNSTSSPPTHSDRTESEGWATETRYYNQHPPAPVNLAVPYSIRRQETNNKL